jgi:hypothetical protein
MMKAMRRSEESKLRRLNNMRTVVLAVSAAILFMTACTKQSSIPKEVQEISDRNKRFAELKDNVNAANSLLKDFIDGQDKLCQAKTPKQSIRLNPQNGDLVCVEIPPAVAAQAPPKPNPAPAPAAPAVAPAKK